ncbi:MAG: GAF domain-containing protein [Candidatus Aminicenantes bacterium]|nr:GAF domain-containing protein [Candidatus Aminicenantes bacterium]
MKKRLASVVIPVVLIALVLGGWNIYQRITWKEPTDGVVWAHRPNGLTAVQVRQDGPAYLSGIKKGDILFKMNGNPVSNRAEQVKQMWLIHQAEQKAIYEIGREGQPPLSPSFYLTTRGTNLGYFYLALVGLTALVLGAVVFFNTKPPSTMPYVYFYLSSLCLFGLYVFSPTGRLDALDTVFFWLDKAAFILFPPLLFHYFSLFPQRKKFLRRRPNQPVVFYVPGMLLLLIQAALHLPWLQQTDTGRIMAFVDRLDKVELLHYSLFVLLTIASVYHSTRRTSSVLVKKQYTWIAYGLGIGVIPFVALTIVPLLLDRLPSRTGELTILFQALIPLTIAYTLSRYRIMDFEIIIKKAATLAFSYFVIASLYLMVSSRMKFFSENQRTTLILGVLAIALGATLFGPLKKLFQSILDRVFYRRSYAYRKTLLFISQELSRERDLQQLGRRLLELMAKALSLKGIALLLTDESRPNTFALLQARGDFSPLPSQLTLDPELFRSFKESAHLSYYTFAGRRDLRSHYEKLSSLGFFQFMPLKVEDKLIGCLAMGKKTNSGFLTSEDWELLTTVAYPVALALENAYLYEQAGVKAMELERLKDYSENIIESLTVGVAVLNQEGRVIGWNRVLEETFRLRKNEVLNHSLFEVLGEANFAVLFPSDTQQDFQLLSEIPMQVATGQNKIFDIAKTPLLDNNLNPYGTIIVFEDITDKIMLQQQLMTSEKLASIGLLSAGVAHEINTPLTGISSYIQMLQKRLTDPHFAQILGKIEVQTDRVARIIKNLLNFARNPSEIAFSRVQLDDSLKEILSLIEYKLKAMNIRLEFRPAALQPIWAQGERLQQVFINIILNALDAMPGGGELRLEVSEQDGEAVVRISDTGMGIKKDHLPRIFDPFFTTKGIGKGTGLGLSISYAIIKEHEGRITVESLEGRGTTFTVVLPKDLDARRKRPPSP